MDTRLVETTIDFALSIALRKFFFPKVSKQLAFIDDRRGTSKRAEAIFEYDNGPLKTEKKLSIYIYHLLIFLRNLNFCFYMMVDYIFLHRWVYINGLNFFK